MAKTVTILNHTIIANKGGMFDLNDLWRGAELPEKKRPSEWRGKDKDALKHSDNLRTENGGSNKGTWATETALYAYAMWVSTDFYMAVVEAFKEAAQGNATKAVDIATSVTISPELIAREKSLRETMNELIALKLPGQRNAFTNFNRLLSKCFSDFTPAQLTASRMSAFQYAVTSGHTAGVGAYLAAMEMVITGLKANLEYHTIAAMMQVKTTKNSHLL